MTPEKKGKMKRKFLFFLIIIGGIIFFSFANSVQAGAQPQYDCYSSGTECPYPPGGLNPTDECNGYEGWWSGGNSCPFEIIPKLCCLVRGGDAIVGNTCSIGSIWPNSDSVWMKFKKCPEASDEKYDGLTCTLWWGKNLPTGSQRFDPPGTSAKWDASEKKCITCNGKVEDKIYADNNAINCNGGNCTDANGDGECESACGADSQCDEANYGKGVIAPSGATCDDCKCVANCGEAKPQCSDGIDNDGDGFCDLPTSVCTDGSTPGDPQCTDANDNDESDGAGTCACQKCPPELQGGLVPCGRMCDDPNTDICECDPCTLCHLFVLFKKIVDFLTLNIISPLAVLMIVVGGVMFLTAAGDPGRIGTAKKILTAVVIGLCIVFLAWLIVDTIITFLTPAGSPFQNWSEINCPVP